ncbi:MAG: hypothetical protein ISR58_21940, partial [Anaerolineales bacterium]|nr:hypothetical protein [Anaerolineales bacterium]
MAGQSHMDFLSGKSPSGSEAQPLRHAQAKRVGRAWQDIFSLIWQPTR